MSRAGAISSLRNLSANDAHVARAPDAGSIRAVRLTLPAIVESVPTARRAVVEAARAAGASERALADVALAVSEACTNVVEHAYREQETPGTLSLSAELHGSGASRSSSPTRAAACARATTRPASGWAWL